MNIRKPLLCDQEPEQCEGEVYRADDKTVWRCSLPPHDDTYECDYSIQVFEEQDEAKTP